MNNLNKVCTITCPTERVDAILDELKKHKEIAVHIKSWNLGKTKLNVFTIEDEQEGK